MRYRELLSGDQLRLAGLLPAATDRGRVASGPSGGLDTTSRREHATRPRY